METQEDLPRIVLGGACIFGEWEMASVSGRRAWRVKATSRYFWRRARKDVFQALRGPAGREESTMGRRVRPCDISGAFNETAAELSDPDVANQRKLFVP